MDSKGVWKLEGGCWIRRRVQDREEVRVEDEEE